MHVLCRKSGMIQTIIAIVTREVPVCSPAILKHKYPMKLEHTQTRLPKLADGQNNKLPGTSKKIEIRRVYSNEVQNWLIN